MDLPWTSRGPRGPPDRPILLIAGGAGGVPLLAAVADRLPGRRLIYAADTARGPFGHAAPETAAAHAGQLVRHFDSLDPELVVLAGHTLSAIALGRLRAANPHRRVVGVTDAAARAASAAAGAATRPRIGVVSAPAAIASGALQAALARRRSRATVLLQPAPLLAALVEENRAGTDRLVRTALKQYLRPMLDRRPDVILLAGGHLTRIAEAVRALAGPDVTVVDPLAWIADDVARRAGPARHAVASAGVECHVTDAPARFARLARRLGHPDLPPAHAIALADLPPLHPEPAPLRRAG